MRPSSSLRKLGAAFLASLCMSQTATAEDIDLFTNPAAGAATAPNILFILDNSANWARNDQAWAIGKQGEAELKALYALMNDPNIGTNVNMGLMMMTSGAPDGAYVRYAVRNMNATNRAAFQEMIGTATCAAGNNSLMGTPNCILNNFNSATEKTNSASTVYSGSIFEAFKYFGGFTDPAHANLDVAGTPVNSTHFGMDRYSVLDTKADPAAFTSAAKTTYKSPINADGSNACAKNYIIFIGNGYPSNDTPISILTGINGDTVVPAGIGNKAWQTANYTKYLNLTDVNALAGRQNVVTYTIDVFNAKPDPSNQTPLLKAMAKYGGGKYFAATNDQAILNAIRDIVVEIQAVNSVFASASLPINATNRSQNENQVFIGMFRPDPDALPRWYGNLKQYKIALFGGDAKLADANGAEAIAATTGFVAPCATSFWTTDSGTYWAFSPPSAGSCTSIPGSTNSDLPDGSVVEKGGAAEVLRRGNLDAPVAGPYSITTTNRHMYTCAGVTCGINETPLPFNIGNVTMARTGAASIGENTNIVNYTFGLDVNNENGDEAPVGTPNVTDPRASIHADIAHSRPLPVNFSPPAPAAPGTRKVEVYYGSNDGVFRAVRGATGRELWSFVAPEHLTKLKRLYLNDPLIVYPNQAVPPTALRKDYFFDGSAGLYQTANNSAVNIFPTQRRGGRMVYGFDVTSATPPPIVKFAVGCPSLTSDTTPLCTAGMSQIGQTWSVPNVGFIAGYSATVPVLIMGGGYDTCEDNDAAVTICGATPKGNKVYVLNGNDGTVIKEFTALRSVAADVTLIDRSPTLNGMVTNAYVADTGGNVYRIDFINNTTFATLGSGSWTMTKIAYTNGGNRKFLFGPAALALGGSKVYLALGSGDRERPLITNYPYTTPVMNRFYSFVDYFGAVGKPTPPVNLDDTSLLKDVSTGFAGGSDCSTDLSVGGYVGWAMDLNTGLKGEQTVTSSVIFGGTVFFSTNRPIASAPGTCSANLGEARGYAVNLLNAAGVVGSGGLCGGNRSGVFVGGGIPPSPVVGTVPVTLPDGTTKSINVLIGGINLDTGGGSSIGAQQPPIPIAQIRSRVFWYPGGER